MTSIRDIRPMDPVTGEYTDEEETEAEAREYWHQRAQKLELENWQLKGALGYPVPGHIPEGPFKCGLCGARDNEIKQLRTTLRNVRGYIKDCDHEPAVDEITAALDDYEPPDPPGWEGGFAENH